MKASETTTEEPPPPLPPPQKKKKISKIKNRNKTRSTCDPKFYAVLSLTLAKLDKLNGTKATLNASRTYFFLGRAEPLAICALDLIFRTLTTGTVLTSCTVVIGIASFTKKKH